MNTWSDVAFPVHRLTLFPCCTWSAQWGIHLHLRWVTADLSSCERPCRGSFSVPWSHGSSCRRACELLTVSCLFFYTFTELSAEIQLSCRSFTFTTTAVSVTQRAAGAGFLLLLFTCLLRTKTFRILKVIYISLTNYMCVKPDAVDDNAEHCRAFPLTSCFPLQTPDSHQPPAASPTPVPSPVQTPSAPELRQRRQASPPPAAVHPQSPPSSPGAPAAAAWWASQKESTVYCESHDYAAFTNLYVEVMLHLAASRGPAPTVLLRTSVQSFTLLQSPGRAQAL